MDRKDLVARRKALGLSQDALARELHMTRQSVHFWETGKRSAPYWLHLALNWLEYESKHRIVERAVEESFSSSVGYVGSTADD
jgi:DNA-binding XRE family transcriptional regulator